MKTFVGKTACLMCLLVPIVAIGCRSHSEPASHPDVEKAQPASKETPNSEPAKPEATAAPKSPPAEAANPEAASAAKPFRLGDLLQPFTPPPLAEIDKTAGWIDRPVLSGMDIMRKKQEAAGPPPVTVAQALNLRNNSAADNAKILGTLGRLAPPDDAGPLPIVPSAPACSVLYGFDSGFFM